MNGGRSFIDTNVLVDTGDLGSPEKQRRALDLYVECRRRLSGVLSI